MVIKAKTPASFAEKYIIQSIWNGHFPQGSILPAERELSDLIGVTRTTLREVLQRLARDGWLTIQHGKPTKVNNYMKTASLSILDTLITLQGQNIAEVIDDLLAARTDFGGIFMRLAFKKEQKISMQLIENVIEKCELIEHLSKPNKFLDTLDKEERIIIEKEIKSIPDAYKEDTHLYNALALAKIISYYDYILFQTLAAYSGNKIYLLTMNGMHKIYMRIGGYYFIDQNAQKNALIFYKQLHELCRQNLTSGVPELIKEYGFKSAEIWKRRREKVVKYMEEED